MRLASGPIAGLAARLLLWALLWLGASMPAAAGFDCARASLQVDFVICRSEASLRAIADLTAAWDNFTATATPDRKAALLDQERRWIVGLSADLRPEEVAAGPRPIRRCGRTNA